MKKRAKKIAAKKPDRIHVLTALVKKQAIFTGKLAGSVEGLIESVSFIKDRMVTKDEVREIVREEVREIVKDEVSEALAPVKNEIAGINRRLDLEAMRRDELQLPKRVSDLEIKNFGASRHPKKVPL